MQDIVTHLLTFIAGLGAGIVVKIKLDARKQANTTNIGDGGGENTINQNRNTVGGNMAGRDVNLRDR